MKASGSGEWRMENNYEFEDNFDLEGWMKWLDHNWALYSFSLIVSYLVLVYFGRQWMASRSPYKLRGALVAWNVGLGVLSIVASWRLLPVLIKSLYYDGWHTTVCSVKYYQPKLRGIWGLVFTLSKIPELGDTVFIVLRKQKLMFLHWYHHSSVILFVFFEYGGMASFSFWFGCMNFPVHSLMYPYYAFRAAGFRPPKWVPMIVTSSQIAQMMMGTYIVCYALVVRQMDVACEVSDGRLAYAMLMYVTYGGLFAHFFINTYLKPKPKRSRDKVDEKNGNVVQISNGQPVLETTDNNANASIRKRDVISG